MLDSDLAALYGVETKALNRAVKRNHTRFPVDFMFRLDLMEADTLLRSRRQFGTLKRGQNIKYLPNVFTEQGGAMLSSVLHSQRAIKVNVAIMRVFVRLRSMLAGHTELAKKLAELEHHIQHHDQQIQSIFQAIRELMMPSPARKIRLLNLRRRNKRCSKIPLKDGVGQAKNKESIENISILYAARGKCTNRHSESVPP